MTINHIRMAFEEDMPSVQKFVFVVLCDMANNESACWPGPWLIAKRASMSEDIVLRELENLKAKGLIEISKNTNFMGKIRNYLFFVYPDKSINDKNNKKTSDLSGEARGRVQDKSINRTNKNNPILASETARAKIAELKKNLGSI